MLRDDATHASSASIAAAIDAILDSIVADAVRKAATDDAQAPAAPTTDAAPDDGTPTDDECPVCFAPMASTVKTIPPCGHAVCLRCLLRLRDRRCVLCRADLADHFPAAAPLSTPPGSPPTVIATRYSPVRLARAPPLVTSASPTTPTFPIMRTPRAPRRPPYEYMPDYHNVDLLLRLAAQPDRAAVRRPVFATHDAHLGAPPVVAEYSA